MEELNKIKATRRGNRAYVSKCQNEIRLIIANFNESQTSKLVSYQKTLEGRLERLMSADEDIQSLISDEEELCADIEASGEIERDIRETLLLIEKCFTKGETRSDSQRSDSTVAGERFSNAKLPKLAINKFRGEPTMYQTFIDTFDSAVHNNRTLDDIAKFTYLKGLLEGPAMAVIAGLSTTAENYANARQLLAQRYGDKQILISAHMERILNIPAARDSEVIKLRRLYDDVEVNIRNLTTLGVDAEKYGALLIPIIMSKLPGEIKLHLSRKMPTDMWDIEILLAELKIELQSRERCSSLLPREVTKPAPTQRMEQYSAAALFTQQRGRLPGCPFCEGNHQPAKCQRVVSVSDRKDLIRKRGLCFTCLARGHLARNCISKVRCASCGGKHHASLCLDSHENARRVDETEKPRIQNGNDSKDSVNLFVENKDSTLLQTALVHISDPLDEVNGSDTRLLLDTGSQRSFLIASIAELIGAKPIRKERILIKCFGDTTESVRNLDVVRIKVQGGTSSLHTYVEAVVVPRICSPISGQRVEIAAKRYEHLRDLPLADVGDGKTPSEVGLLIGADYYWSFVTGRVKRPPNGFGPVALHTNVGWVLSGRIEGTAHNSANCNLSVAHVLRVNVLPNDVSLSADLERFFANDDLGICIPSCDTSLERITSSIDFKNGRYSVKLPLKNEDPSLPDYYFLCKKRLHNLLNKLRTDEDMFREYDKLIRGYMCDGIVEEVDTDDIPEPGRVMYLPHKAVIRSDKATSRMRIVYDASAKLKDLPSLNEALHSGPNLLPLMLDVILRFRSHNVVITGDIKSAFLNISVDKRDRNLLRFLWINNTSTLNPEIVVLRFTRLIFGLNCSPFILAATLRHHLEGYKDRYPAFVEQFLRDLYVDDLVTGGKCAEDCFQLYQASSKIMDEGQFKLRKWKTNDMHLRDRILASEKHSLITETDETLGKGEKVLGLKWNEEDDQLSFSFAGLEDTMSDRLTKRSMLKIAASLFDPLGVFSPLIMRGKLLLQEVNGEKLGWDEEVSESIQARWKEFLRGLDRSGEITLNRNYFVHSISDPVTDIELHAFSDASAYGYASVIYFVGVRKSGTRVGSYVISKTKVASLKKVTLPRLELLSCLLSTQLVASVSAALKQCLKVSDIRCWNDSMDALYWIKGTAKVWKPYVQNRVVKIREIVKPTSWYFVPGAQNPADIGTRGLATYQDIRNGVWTSVPNFLLTYDLPKQFVVNDYSNAKIEESVNIAPVDSVPESSEDLFGIRPCSSYKKLIAIMAYVVRFVTSIRLRINRQDELHGELSSEELYKARILLIRRVQSNAFSKNMTTELGCTIGVHTDTEGILRTAGRFTCMEAPDDERNLIILPSQGRFVELLILDTHVTLKHGTVRDTLNDLRSKYWVLRGRRTVTRVLKTQCLVCRRFEKRLMQPPPVAPLPDYRTSVDYAFSNVGVDYLGPVYVKDLYSKSEELHKCYAVLFTCATSRAVCLDLAVDLTPEGFLRSLQRFIGRFGVPKRIISDNAKNFTSPVTQKYVAFRNIEWTCILPTAPWWGGFWERLVRSVKRSLRPTLGRANVSFEELLTILREIEGVLNSRPLGYLYEDGEEALTPSHLVFGRRILSQSSVYPACEMNLSKRAVYLSSLVDKYWARWKREYLTELREHHRLGTKEIGDPIAVDDLVLVSHDTLPRSRWRLGRITRLIKGVDGHIRGAELRTTTDRTGRPLILTRPLQRLVQLEVSAPKPSAETEQGAVKVERGRRVAALTGEAVRRLREDL